MSIIEFACHELRIAHGQTLVIPSLCEWKAFPMSGDLSHTMITWALSPTTSQVPGVIPESPCVHGVYGLGMHDSNDVTSSTNDYINVKDSSTNTLKNLHSNDSPTPTMTTILNSATKVDKNCFLERCFGISIY